MGITKQYLRYVPSSNFNIICHPDCNVVFVTLNGIADRFVAVGACENVIVWDLRLAKSVMIIENEDMKNNSLKKNTVVKLATNPDGKRLAVGYSDGVVNTFDLTTGDITETYQGHRSAITALSYNSECDMLASGSKDTDVVIWDVVSETGLHRLSGHKGVVTAVQFLNKHKILLTASKDTYIKFWDLTTGHCFKTLAGHITEVWTLSVLRNDEFLVAGSSDSELRTWRISEMNKEESEIKMSLLLSSDTITDFNSSIKCEKAGSLIREGFGRVISSVTDNSNHVICCHGHGKLLELFMFIEHKEALEHFRNRQRKFKKKATKRGENYDDVAFLNEKNPSLQDIVKRLPSILTDFKIKSVDLVLNKTHIKIVVSMANNSLALFSVSLSDKKVKLIRKISHHGHRTNVNVLAFTLDNLTIFTGSSDSVKMWNRKTLNCIGTVDMPNSVHCLCVFPDNRYILAGLENGCVLIIDIAAGNINETISAHSKDLKSIFVLPNEVNCITCGYTTVKLWKFEWVTVPNSDRKVLSLLHLKTLKLDECVQCAKVSPDNRLLAVALLDNTVKIFFMDTFKHFIDLYGHTLPINDMDISYDSSIIITASVDKTIRIWGLDFGDCHKRLTTDCILTGIKFVPKTHQFFTTDKNGNVKHWDADIYERILTLQGHRGESNNLCVSENGYYIISCGRDNVIRLFEKTEELLVFEDEREEERTKNAENELATGEEINVYGGPSVLALPMKKTVSSEKSAELLLECLEVIKEYQKCLSENENKNLDKPQLPIIMTAFNVKTTDEYLLEIIKRIRSNELEEVLLLMPFSSVCYFMELLVPLLSHIHHQIEPVIRSLVFLVQTLHKPILSASDMLPVLRQLNILATKRTSEFRDLIGENLHALMLLNNSQEEESVIFNVKQKVNKKAKKRKIKSIVII